MKSDDEKADCRASAFQAFYHPESTYLEKTPTAQLTRIDAAERLFSVPLTRITSVPECAVSSVGFLWGSATVSQACGASAGLAEALICPAFPIHGARVPRLPEVTQRHRSGLPAGVDSAPEDRITDRYHFLRTAVPERWGDGRNRCFSPGAPCLLRPGFRSLPWLPLVGALDLPHTPCATSNPSDTAVAEVPSLLAVASGVPGHRGRLRRGWSR